MIDGVVRMGFLGEWEICCEMYWLGEKDWNEFLRE